MLLASWSFYTIEKGFRSLNAKNLESVDQRAVKLLGVNVGVLKKKSAALAIPADLCARAFGPGSNPGAVEHFQSLTAGNFEALWPKDLKFSAFKDLSPFSIVSKFQEAGSF